MSTEIILAGQPYVLKWGRGAIVRADNLGLFGDTTAGQFAFTAKQVWCMLPEAGRRRFPNFESVFEAMPPINDVLPAIHEAMEAGKEETDPKKLFGSTNGPSPSSS